EDLRAARALDEDRGPADRAPRAHGAVDTAGHDPTRLAVELLGRRRHARATVASRPGRVKLLCVRRFRLQREPRIAYTNRSGIPADRSRPWTAPPLPPQAVCSRSPRGENPARALPRGVHNHAKEREVLAYEHLWTSVCVTPSLRISTAPGIGSSSNSGNGSAATTSLSLSVRCDPSR